ncbi:phage portal protein [Bacillus sp. FJAT-26390]|uniref:phage portal protein n=1 Tax=Bacillus sp. FJAT-26390 TaxID=1743142 RepID=UPI001C3FFE2D|nr:phage portal protein [Bacillus sp. FJAT-26390]
MIGFVAPGWAEKRASSRAETARHEAVRNVMAGYGKGYGRHGASQTKKSMVMWQTSAGDADADIHNNLEQLRTRARDLHMGSDIVAAAHKGLRTNIVGTGLKLKPAFDSKYLKLSKSQEKKLRDSIYREWSMWAETTKCDAAGLNDFYELQSLAFISSLMSGDVFGLLPMLPRKHSVYDLRVNIVEADRCDTPLAAALLKPELIQSGVEVDDDGMVVAYHFSNHHPGSDTTAVSPKDWVRVEKYGKLTGRLNVIHLFEAERPGQRRGIPVISPIIESLKQLDQYTEAELMAAVIAAMYTVFVKTPAEDDDYMHGMESPETDNQYQEPIPGTGGDNVKMGRGAIVYLDPGEEVQFANPTRPNPDYVGFVNALLRQISAALELPFEILTKQFTSSYSASRGALLEAWKMYRMRRSWLAKSFCQPIYEEWFVEAVTKGRIDAPGIFDDPAIFHAYTRAEWHGPSQGLLDPTKEVDAAVTRIENNFSTAERETAELTGGSWEQNIEQRAYEKTRLADLGLSSNVGADPQQQASGKSEDDADESSEGGEEENAEKGQA